MNKDLRDIMPQKIISPTSLEDIGWNSCCQKMEDNLRFYAQLRDDNVCLANRDVFTDALAVN